MNNPTAADKRRFDAIVKLGCIVGPSIYCDGRITVHHCFTKMGMTKKHQDTIPLCWGHHLGPHGVDGKRLGKRVWEGYYGSERMLLDETNRRLNAT